MAGIQNNLLVTVKSSKTNKNDKKKYLNRNVRFNYCPFREMMLIDGQKSGAMGWSYDSVSRVFVY